MPVLLVGGHLTRDDLALLDLIERAGGRVVCNATDLGERTLPPPINRRQLVADPLAAIVDAHAAIPTIWQRPNDGLYRWLRDAIKQRNPAGMIICRHGWCDLWHAEVGRLRDWTPLPVLDLDISSESRSPASLAGRVEAFMEVLR